MMQKKIPFEFVLDYLLPLEITVKPMFGFYSIYVGKKIILVLRQQKTHPEVNGVWIATQKEYHKSLKKELPSLCSVSIYTKGLSETEWQMLPADANDFETSVIKVCKLIVHGDPRIGRLPKPH